MKIGSERAFLEGVKPADLMFQMAMMMITIMTILMIFFDDDDDVHRHDNYEE